MIVTPSTLGLKISIENGTWQWFLHDILILIMFVSSILSVFFSIAGVLQILIQTINPNMFPFANPIENSKRPQIIILLTWIGSIFSLLFLIAWFHMPSAEPPLLFR